MLILANYTNFRYYGQQNKDESAPNNFSLKNSHCVAINHVHILRFIDLFVLTTEFHALFAGDASFFYTCALIIDRIYIGGIGATTISIRRFDTQRTSGTHRMVTIINDSR